MIIDFSTQRSPINMNRNESAMTFATAIDCKKVFGKSNKRSIRNVITVKTNNTDC